MHLKTKIFTLIVCAILIIPVLINPPQSSREVLGVNDTTSTTSTQVDPLENIQSEPQPVVAQEEDSVPSVVDIIVEKTTNTQESSNKLDQVPDVITSIKSLTSSGISLPLLLPSTNAIQDANPQLQDISSGVRTSTAEIFEPKKFPLAKGKITWQNSPGNLVSTDKFPLGSSIQVITDSGQVFDLVVTSTKVLPTDTVLVVDPFTFQQLEGDPLTQFEITGQVQINQL